MWNEDQAGPVQTLPYLGSGWQPEGLPARHPHEYIRRGTAKLLTLFHPATGEVRVKGARRRTNVALQGQPWVMMFASPLAALIFVPLIVQTAQPW